MKKSIVITFLLGFVCINTFAQKVIENPEYGFNSLPGTITKVELLDTTTVLHFHLKMHPGGRFFIPKQSYIQDLKGGDKLFITKARGTKLGKWNAVPESGENIYSLYFPKLDKNIKTIDFGEANEGGDWKVYDIVINEDEDVLRLPKVLRGNWMLTDGSNQWHYGFYSKRAVIDKHIWNYKSIEAKGKKYTIVLENGSTIKTVYAKLLKNDKVEFGENRKKLQSYSLKKVNNPNYKLVNNVEYTEPIFNLDSTTYSGFIKGFTTRAEQKTGTMHVNNAFSGHQDTYLIKIADDGSFSVKFPITHPQSTFVRMPNGAYSVFVEPSKETFHCIDGKESFFMGDCAQVNSDLQALEFIRYFNHQKTRKNIGLTSPKDYKKVCLDVRDKELKALKEYASSHFVSAKAFQIKNIQIELTAYQNALGYGMFRRSLKSQNEKAKSVENKKPFKDFKVHEDYYDFIPKDIINNRLALLSNGYYFFVNRLIYADLFKVNQSSRATLVEFADWLQKNNKELTVEELEMVEMSKQIETPEIIKKEQLFRKAYGKVEQAFYKKNQDNTKAYGDYLKENDLKPKHSHFLLNMAEYLKEKGEILSDEEMKMIEAVKIMKTKEEYEKERVFNETYGKVKVQFYNKYGKSYSDMSSDKYYSDRDNNIKAFFGKSDAFLYDVIRFQRASKRLEDYNVYTDDELTQVQSEIKNPFLANYLAVTNEQTKINIEKNKTKGGYNVNQVNKTEGDELFDTMLKKFKGKVVYVDFWATWCAPCKSGIKRIAPLKETMKNDDVVFLYITNQTSPEGTWKNAIANIKGEHYRVSADEWNYLTEKFNISGIPHYVLVNKQGKVVNPKMGHNPNAKLKTIFKAEIQK
ncbi:TlpA family protein disulfide reductase [Flavivirga rizhaonensis]|uniref:TlpA family protein disulfide reductase n=1 Tax=Flavivirga rizhaonensis TaxID=2559571 RepID=A0A4S1DTR8_9FLAO|nr:TlpA disulfide reductase family protein [Flavivirga rizhaonensis]TGV01387.1 TlpA family protein disulfide reductase [Flavivirga rizhaonensis]